MPKSKAKPQGGQRVDPPKGIKKPAPPPAPPKIRPIPLPPICTEYQIQIVSITLKSITPPHGTMTLRQIEAAVGFLIQEQQRDSMNQPAR